MQAFEVAPDGRNPSSSLWEKHSTKKLNQKNYES